MRGRREYTDVDAAPDIPVPAAHENCTALRELGWALNRLPRNQREVRGDCAALRGVAEPLGTRHAGLDVFGLRPQQLGARDQMAGRIDAVENRAGQAFAIDPELRSERKQPLRIRRNAVVVTDTKIFVQQPDPLGAVFPGGAR